MPEAHKPKRVRKRPGYVMVEMTPRLRAKLERLSDQRAARGEDKSLAGTIRWLIERYPNTH